MKIAIKRRDRRAVIALVLAVVAYLLISIAVIPAYQSLHDGESTAQEKEEILRKYRRVVGRKGRYVELIAQVRKQSEQAETRVIRAATPSLAAVELQSLVETSAQKFNIPLQQRNVPTPAISTEPIREMTMTLSFESTPVQLVSFLTELRAAPKAIRVLTMNVNPTQVAQVAPKSGKFSKNIRVALTLGAWFESASGGR